MREQTKPYQQRGQKDGIAKGRMYPGDQEQQELQASTEAKGRESCPYTRAGRRRGKGTIEQQKVVGETVIDLYLTLRSLPACLYKIQAAQH
jgi:hypothetical protein